VEKTDRDITRRSVTSVAWNIVSNLLQILVSFVRSWLLARWLPVETFGVYALAGSIVGISGIVANFGMGGAFLHRAPETEDERQAAAVHFTLKSLFTFIWAAVLVTGGLAFTDGKLRLALLVLTGTAAIVHLTQTPRLILVRRVVHRRLALLQLLATLFASLSALGLASQGIALWALLSTNIVTASLHIVMLYIWRPVWRPQLTWSRSAVRYLLRFGSRNVVAALLLRALDRVDDLWTGLYLGQVSLGFYSRAYTFATYPRKILAAPVNAVVGGTYAELQEDRERLSRAFFRTNAFLVRTGFLLAGLLALVAPEFIRLALGTRWLPMLDAFRLMLVFTLLDPIKMTVANLFVAVGRPDQVVEARAIQLAALAVGLFLLGPWLGITGVALAVDVMLVIGIAILLRWARAYVDFSIRRLFLVPVLGLASGLLLARGISTLPEIAGSDWRTGSVKIGVFLLIYGIALLGLERRQLSEMLSSLAVEWFRSLARDDGNDGKSCIHSR